LIETAASVGILLHSLRKINALFTTFSSILLLFLKKTMEKMNPKKNESEEI